MALLTLLAACSACSIRGAPIQRRLPKQLQGGASVSMLFAAVGLGSPGTACLWGVVAWYGCWIQPSLMQHLVVQALKRTTAGRPVVGVGLEVGFENQDTRDSRIVVRLQQHIPTQPSRLQRLLLLCMQAWPHLGVSLGPAGLCADLICCIEG